MKNIIEVKKLHKKFWFFKKDFKRIIWLLNRNKFDKEFHVLKGISFDVHAKETVGILGVNGAGKSTLLKIVSGIYNPTAGSVKVDGKVSSLIELGAGFNNELTGLENIYLKGTITGMKTTEIDAIIDDVVEFADIGEYMDMPLSSYSSGMKARLGFALAVSVDPDILIIDEVFAVGDKDFQNKSKKKTEEFFKQGKTILFVSHSEGLIREFCERVIYLKDGKIAYDGPVEGGLEVYRKDVNFNSLVPFCVAKKVEQIDGFYKITAHVGLAKNWKFEADLPEMNITVTSEKKIAGEHKNYLVSDEEFKLNVVDKNTIEVLLPFDSITTDLRPRINITYKGRLVHHMIYMRAPITEKYDDEKIVLSKDNNSLYFKKNTQ